MKMSEIFHLPLELRKDLVHFSKSDTCYFKVESAKSRDEELQVTYCIHQAINNYDRLLEENSKLREVLERLVNPDNCKKDIIHIIGNAESLLNQLKEQNNDK